MESKSSGIFAEFSFPLSDLVEEGPAFRVGSPSLPFVLSRSREDEWKYVNEEHGLEMRVGIRCVESGAFVVSSRLQNCSRRPSPPLDILEPLRVVFRKGSKAWRHSYAEGGTSEAHYPPSAYRTHEWTRVGETIQIESPPDGRSSDRHLPLLISLTSTDSGSAGFFCGLEWSAEWYIRFEGLAQDKSALSMGVKVNLLELKPGETLDLPDVHIGFFQGGPAAGTNALRRYLYHNVCAKVQGKPMSPFVSYDHWFGIGNNYDENLLKAEAARAAELGIEVFVVDAAWFAGGFPDGVGNWRDVDRKKFPDGLEPLAEYVRSLGMHFGLWFEPERAHEETQLYRERPEWFFPRDRDAPEANGHLNLALPEVQDYLIEMVGTWIRRLDIRWTRWDYNINPQPFWQRRDPTGKIQFTYMKGLYRVLDTLMSKYPNWMVEGCASGGRRLDIGTMRRAHTFWFSDQSHDPFLCRYMQARANRFLPGHLLNSSLAVNLDHGDEGFDDTAVLSRMLGKLAFDGDIASWSASLTSRMARWVEEFKAVRHLMVQDFYQLLPLPTTIEDWDAVEFANYSGEQAVVFAFRGAGTINGMNIPLRGLSRNHRYQISRRPERETCSVDGKELLENGLSVVLEEGGAGLWKITKI